ncbi:helix-turn-helix domain-containing protein [Pseudomonas mediterranea]|uniref:helix-turn-helix domain-containing protein n=1 Tax=Pseudomonas mediterranea TaxID=183795 RepID=UPI0006D8CA40|nr:helix-turn-helix domain-containing protein [Pseudomonas mediterranea]
MSHTFQQSPTSNRECLTVWREEIFHKFEQLEIVDIQQDQPFHAELTLQGSGPARTARLSSGSQTVQRDSVTCNAANDVCLLLIESGNTVLTQDGGQLLLSSGDLIIFENTRPYTLEMLERFEHSMLLCHKRNYAVELGFIESHGPVKMKDGPTTALLRQLVHGTVNTSSQMNDSQIGHATFAALHLCAAVMGPSTENVVTRDRVSQALFTRICAGIRASLRDPTLSPTTIAQTHQISLRYLHKLFAQHGMQVMKFVRDERLAACSRELQAAVTRPHLATLASKWGFEDDSNFRRAFRKAYGYAPGQRFKT